MNADFVDFSRWLTWVSVGLNSMAIVFVLGAFVIRDRRWVHAARNALMLNGLVLVGSAAGLVGAFFVGRYDLEYVYSYSERALPGLYKFCGLWAGLDGSILFWAMLLAVMTAITAFGFRREQQHPVGVRIEPHVYMTLALIQLFFLATIAIVADPFTSFAESAHGAHQTPLDGAGLNPLLINYWMQIHPPCLYVGWVMYTIPFAFGVASVIAKEMGSYWIRKVRRWMLVAWMFNTSGCVLGGLWAYEVLGWGGYWAWDPVENASLIPWFTSTAFLHSVMVQERRDMLKVWNFVLIGMTFFFTIMGTWLTRSGFVSSQHAFASGDVGVWFMVFMLAVLCVTVGLSVVRLVEFRAKNRVESIFSREAAFVFNNMILVVLAFSIAIMTLWPGLTEYYGNEQITIAAPTFNLVTTPLFCILLLLTAIGPGLAWIKTSGRAMARNFFVPAILAVPVGITFQWIASSIHAGDTGTIPLMEHIYPTGLVNVLGAFAFLTVVCEIVRTAHGRAKRRGLGFVSSVINLMVKNNRRYGGYTVHVGLGLIAIGIVNSSMFQVERNFRLGQGETIELGEYTAEVTKSVRDDDHPVYGKEDVELTVSKNGSVAAVLSPEIRYYPPKGNKAAQMIREVGIARTLGQDIYASAAPLPGGEYDFTFYRNPIVFLVWLGWLTMVAGGLWAAVPMGRRRRVGLSD